MSVYVGPGPIGSVVVAIQHLNLQEKEVKALLEVSESDHLTVADLKTQWAEFYRTTNPTLASKFVSIIDGQVTLNLQGINPTKQGFAAFVAFVNVKAGEFKNAHTLEIQNMPSPGSGQYIEFLPYSLKRLDEITTKNNYHQMTVIVRFGSQVAANTLNLMRQEYSGIVFYNFDGS